MEGPQLFCLRFQLLRVFVIHSRQQDPNLPGKALQKNAGKQVRLLLAPWAGLHHGRHHLSGRPAAQRRHEKKPLSL
ncbi:MAG: hypothetical protein ACK559_08205, partial [bacterium]